MPRRLRTAFLVFLLTFSLNLFATQASDRNYAFRRVTVALVNLSGNPVYGEAVENSLVQAIAKNSRFEPSDRGFITLREALKGQSLSLGEERTGTIGPLSYVVEPLLKLGLDSVVLAELLDGNDGYRIRLALVLTMTAEKVHQVDVTVSDTSSLEGFASAAREALSELIKGIPFDSSVLSREGYRVVLDRGYPYFHRGMQATVYTLNEAGSGVLLFQETGVVSITRAEANLSFGQIVAERGALAIAPGNKIRSATSARVVEGSLRPVDGNDGRAPASVTEDGAAARDNIGYVHLDAGASSLNWENSAANGGGSYSRSGTYLGGSLLAQIWLTSRWFVDLGLGFASATLSDPSGGLNSTANHLASQLGYRLDLPGFARAPSMYLKGGLARRQLEVATSPDPLALTNLAYSGLLVGAGAKIPLGEKWGIGVDLQTLLFGSVSESPITSGSSTQNVSWWDLGLRGYYAIANGVEVEGKLQFLTNGVDFSGVGTRATPLASSSQNAHALLAGVAYYF